MTYKLFTGRLGAVVLVTAAGLAACKEDDTTTVPPSTSAAAPTEFSVLAEQAFAQAPNSTPVTINGLNIFDDVYDQPDAFAALIASGSYQ